jgi:hypothetical protein
MTPLHIFPAASIKSTFVTFIPVTRTVQRGRGRIDSESEDRVFRDVVDT